ncbi:MAG TPA: NAD(P)/FAD-dependent oxidoreductase, partial [Pseudonocardia sp.]
MADPRPDRPDRIDIQTAVEGGHLPALLAALRCLTGDPTLTAAALRPQVTGLASADHGLTPDQRAEAVRLATDRLVAWFAQGCPPGAAADEATLRELLEFCAGNDSEDPPAGPGDRYMPLLRQELGLDGSDLRAPGWTADELAPGREFRVAIIGAGFSGLAMAHRCRQAGIEFVVLEKNPDVGGTWAENTYPGCRVDVPSHLYTFTFAPRDDWPHVYSTQPDIHTYLRDTAINLGITPRIRFRTEITQARWDEQASTWTLELATPNGPESLTAHALVSAVGQLNRPNIPDIPGADTFRGPAFHSARWDHRVDLNGVRVAVIGTGASAAQLVPEIARNAGHVSVFQRTPAWFIPGPDYRHTTPDAQHWLCAQVPGYSRWYRFLLFRWYVDGLMPSAQVDR